MNVFLRKRVFFFLKKKKSRRNLRAEGENIIKDTRNIFRLKKLLNYTANKDIINLFRGEKETKAIKDRIHRDIKSLFDHEEEEN